MCLSPAGNSIPGLEAWNPPYYSLGTNLVWNGSWCIVPGRGWLEKDKGVSGNVIRQLWRRRLSYEIGEVSVNVSFGPVTILQVLSGLGNCWMLLKTEYPSSHSLSKCSYKSWAHEK